MDKKAQNWQLGLGAALIVLGAYLYSQQNLHIPGIILVIIGIGLIVSKSSS